MAGMKINRAQWICVAAAAIAIVMTAVAINSDKRATEQKAAAEVQRIANLTGYQKEDYDAWTSLLGDPSQGKINNPMAFAEHCGQPTMRVNGKTSFGLLYSEHNLSVLFIRRKIGSSKQELARGGTFLPYEDQAFFNQISPIRFVSTESALKTLGCTAVVAKS
ncbi:MAG: hypothetical protein M3O31_07065 [Acidobacteriota bacterium]|nr:hypothetical protein [Acidobacteriota bacterium]